MHFDWNSRARVCVCQCVSVYVESVHIVDVLVRPIAHEMLNNFQHNYYRCYCWSDNDEHIFIESMRKFMRCWYAIVVVRLFMKGAV